MAVDAVLFVSKRASVAAAAVLCLMAGRLLAAPPTMATVSAGEVRVAISR